MTAPVLALPGMACAVPTSRNPKGRTGTTAGYLAHYYVKEEACEKCRVGHAAQIFAKRREDPEINLRSNLYYKYRLPLERYREILERQGGCCAICGVDAPTDIRTDRFHVDHDHACCPGTRSCGKCVRGLLCHGCNTALGNFKDDPEILRAALRYLGEHGK